MFFQLSPFSDLDTEEKDFASKSAAAKAAFLTIMKTWIGIIMLTSDEAALPFLMKILRDSKVIQSYSLLEYPFLHRYLISKVPNHIHELILDSLSEILQPIYSTRVSPANFVLDFHLPAFFRQRLIFRSERLIQTLPQIRSSRLELRMGA